MKSDSDLLQQKILVKGKAVLMSSSREDTIACGKMLAGILKKGDVVALDGDLGAGKTTLIKGIAAGLGLEDQDEVKSPTFVLMHIYEASLTIYHFDLYRLEEAKDFEAIGLQDFAGSGHAVTCVEWAQKAPQFLPDTYYSVFIRTQHDESREILIERKRINRTTDSPR